MNSVDKTLKDIRYWINEYHSIREGNSIEDLLSVQDEISLRSFTLATYVGEYKGSMNSAYFNRKISIARKSINLQKQGSKMGTADNQALIDNEEKFQLELDHEATAVSLDLLLKQTNIVLQTIMQRISYLKAEKTKQTNQC